MKDLVVLVADVQQEAVVETLLEKRHQSLQIRHLSKKRQEFQIFVHPQRDPGVYTNGGALLSLLAQQYKYALVMLDAEWEGGPKEKKLKKEQQKLKRKSKMTSMDGKIAVGSLSLNQN